MVLYFREIKGAHNIVVATISLFKELISNTEWNTAKYDSFFLSVATNMNYDMYQFFSL